MNRIPWNKGIPCSEETKRKISQGNKGKYDLANITGIYNRDFKNWQYQCRKCHMEDDGRLDALHRRLYK